jgi:hypothetical protein
VQVTSSDRGPSDLMLPRVMALSARAASSTARRFLPLVYDLAACSCRNNTALQRLVPVSAEREQQ